MRHTVDLAEEWASSAWKRFQLTPPVDLTIICKALKINFRQKGLDAENGGYLLRTPKRRYIVLNKNHDICRQRFVIGHEICEYLLDRSNNQLSHNIATSLCDKANRERERFCDRFAARLLMPGDWVRKLAVELHHSAKNNKADVLAGRFGVSVQAMQIRLRELGLDEYSKQGEWSEARFRETTRELEAFVEELVRAKGGSL